MSILYVYATSYTAKYMRGSNRGNIQYNKVIMNSVVKHSHALLYSREQAVRLKTLSQACCLVA